MQDNAGNIQNPVFPDDEIKKLFPERRVRAGSDHLGQITADHSDPCPQNQQRNENTDIVLNIQTCEFNNPDGCQDPG